MKKPLFLSVVILAIGFIASLILSCDKELLSLSVPIAKEFDFTVDSVNFKSTDKLLYQTSTDINIEQAIRDYGGNPNLLKSGNVKSVEIQVIEPASLNLSPFSALRVTVQKTGAAETDIASASVTNAQARSITLTVTPNQEALDYLKQSSSFFVRVYGTMALKMPTKTNIFRLVIKWNLKVGL